MCGIVGAVAQRDVAEILMAGIRRLEYRGYDSAGLATIDHDNTLNRLRTMGKVQQLADALAKTPLTGTIGISHTRWATHGKPSEVNAHPHVSGEKVALVHNGIIENFAQLREELIASGYQPTTETDTEVIVHLIHRELAAGKALLAAVQAVVPRLEGAYALAIIHCDEPDKLVAVRSGSPLVVGLGIGEHFVASDALALSPVARQFVYLEEGDIVEVQRKSFTIYDAAGTPVTRKICEHEFSSDTADKGKYRHFMQKEIFEQAEAVAATLEARLGKTKVLEPIFGEKAPAIFDAIDQVQIVACGTSYHAGCVARYWLESIAGLPCQVEVASEYRYRDKVVQPKTLFLTISQSGETADTLAALRQAKQLGYGGYLAICNVPESSLARESDLCFMTRAGVEIGVASTKAFTTQLTALLLLTVVLGRRHQLTDEQEETIVKQLKHLPHAIVDALELDDAIQGIARVFTDKYHALFLGRGSEYPIALEGALKLKEISYIHAEAYPAGELKHGPLALVDKDMPVIAVAPKDNLLEKLKSNLQEVRARGGELIVFADSSANIKSEPGINVLEMPDVDPLIAPVVYTIPLQLLAYYVAVIKGTDVDQPRNLAKSVTVE
ncbi:MAG: glutamine--fructose-6-phosphate transaminase (isomerizing) [Legionellales bacterium]|nr:glutamine--fructose-6-phosphate transaminase (isomerizing) [Legionellales bacterium]|tara:strand:+ start:99707 stop:101539 length:1833 start_codon:yes stop_codon:yes gene_type:complete